MDALEVGFLDELYLELVGGFGEGVEERGGGRERGRGEQGGEGGVQEEFFLFEGGADGVGKGVYGVEELGGGLVVVGEQGELLFPQGLLRHRIEYGF